jgi:hypothetical protein
MKPHPQHPHELLDQLLDNSAALCQASLSLRAATQRSTLSAQDIERKLAFASRIERLVWVLMLVGSIGFCFTVYRYFPDWLPTSLEHWPASNPFIKPV